MKIPSKVTVPWSELINKFSITIRVTGVRRGRLRLRLGVAIMTLGAWVSGMRVGVEINPS